MGKMKPFLRLRLLKDMRGFNVAPNVKKKKNIALKCLFVT